MPNFPFLRDPKTGKKSVTLSVFVWGFLIASAKLLFAGLEFGKFKSSDFSGVDFGAVIAALGAVYTMRKNNSIKPDSSDAPDPSSEEKK